MLSPDALLHPFFFEAHHAALKSRLDVFVPEAIEPLASLQLGEAEESREAVRRLAASGLLRYTIPAGYGGAAVELDSRALCLIREALGYSSGLVDTAFAIQGLGSYTVAVAGNEAQKQRYLPGVATGELIPSFAITEPEAGSDVASLTTSARREGDHYVLNGAKRFISNAGIANYYVVFARTGEPGHRGISAFVVEASDPGLTPIPFTVMAPHPIGELHFSDCRIPADRLLGHEGKGFGLAMGTLDRFRPTVGGAALGMARRALHESLNYTTRRKQFGVPLAEHQLVKATLADMAVELEAARLLVFQAAWVKDTQGGRATQEAAMGKLFSTEAAQRIIDSAVQLHGGNGVVSGAVVERLYREIRALRIYEGTSEIQRLVIGGGLVKSWQSAR